MPSRQNTSDTLLRPRLRITQGTKIPLGPGKADLLEHIEKTGSIASAAKRMKMSYMKAWLLIEEMHATFKSPVIAKVRGGAAGGGARLTTTGQRILSLYREMEATSVQASKPAFEKLRSLLR